MPPGIHLEVYNLADHTLVDSLLQQDHNPSPMVKRRPVEKTPTASEKFDEQQSEYDTRVKNKDRMKQVHEHNSGYPQLRDELDKRRSVSNITTMNRKTETDPKTRYNSNSRQLKNPRRKERRTKRRILKPRITKTKNKKEKSKLYNALKHSRQKPSVCEICGSPRVYSEKELRINSTSNSVSTSSIEKCKSNHTEETMANMSQKYPDSREPSMSSYHSFYSSDHEPMC